MIMIRFNIISCTSLLIINLLISVNAIAQGLTEKYASFDIGLWVGGNDFGDYTPLDLQFS